MKGVSSRTRSRNATRFRSVDGLKGRKKVLKNDERKKAKDVVVDVEKGNKSEDIDVSNGKGGNFFKDGCGLQAEKPVGVEDDEELKHSECTTATATVSSDSLEKEVPFEKESCFEKKGVKRVRKQVESNDDDVQVTISLKEKSKTEMELDELWEQLTISLKEEQVIGNIGENEATPKNKASPTSLCVHDDFYLDEEEEEIGSYCKRCGFVETEIKNISPPVVNRFPYDESQFKDYDGDSEAILCHKEATVWDFIPDVKQSLYPHQQQGFEFIWQNLAGNIYLNKLESPNHFSEGGCIISHYPGTGKTRLTLMFLKTYLQVFPKCLPVIVAPASLLITWEDEFKKWDIGVPFHNLNNPELSGKEHDDAVNSVVDCLINLQRDTEALRMVKLYSWIREKSILGISYKLYAQLAGSKTRKKNGKENIMGKVLREVPRLLVLDEGHIPRNRKSHIWKVLTEQVQTKKRIILSGTPFQNNFVELYNTLTLVKPSFPDTIPLKLKKFCRNKQRQEKKSSQEWSWEPISSENIAGNLADDKMIRQLKSRMDSFVHVHKGSILKKKLQ